MEYVYTLYRHFLTLCVLINLGNACVICVLYHIQGEVVWAFVLTAIQLKEVESRSVCLLPQLGSAMVGPHSLPRYQTADRHV